MCPLPRSTWYFRFLVISSQRLFLHSPTELKDFVADSRRKTKSNEYKIDFIARLFICLDVCECSIRMHCWCRLAIGIRLLSFNSIKSDYFPISVYCCKNNARQLRLIETIVDRRSFSKQARLVPFAVLFSILSKIKKLVAARDCDRQQQKTKNETRRFNFRISQFSHKIKSNK